MNSELFYAVRAVSHEKEYSKVFKISHFSLTFSMEKREKHSNHTRNDGTRRIGYPVKTFLRRSQKRRGKSYSRNTAKAIRSGLDRFLSGSPQRKPFSIIRDKMFKAANEALDASLKDLARYGLISSINHKRPISKRTLKLFMLPSNLVWKLQKVS